jgi:hypothetical protein
VKVVGLGPVMLTMQTGVVFLLGLIPGAVVGAVLGGASTAGEGFVAIVVAAAGLAWLFRRWMTRKKSEALGTREPARISIGSSDVHIERAGRSVAGQAIRDNINRRMPQSCFTVTLHHANDSKLIAAGLDPLTADNLVDDLGNDLGMGDAPAVRAAAQSPRRGRGGCR